MGGEGRGGEGRGGGGGGEKRGGEGRGGGGGEGRGRREKHQQFTQLFLHTQHSVSSPTCSLAASNQMSSFFGHTSHPRMMTFLAFCI